MKKERKKQANDKSTDGRFEYAEGYLLTCSTNHHFYLLGIRLVITRCVLGHTLPVTQLLQSKGGDIVAGLHLIQSLKNLFVAMRLINIMIDGIKKLLSYNPGHKYLRLVHILNEFFFHHK